MTKPSSQRGQHLSGVVVAAQSPKTVAVEVRRRVKHSRYGKYFIRRKRYQVHDEKNCQLGERVQIRSGRPLSRRKAFVVVNKL